MPYLVEKGIDVRIAIDIIMLAIKKLYDIAVIFSQDQDLSEIADEIRNISKERNTHIHIASIFPKNENQAYCRGINRTEWITLTKSEYDTCIDVIDYR